VTDKVERVVRAAGTPSVEYRLVAPVTFKVDESAAAPVKAEAPRTLKDEADSKPVVEAVENTIGPEMKLPDPVPYRPSLPRKMEPAMSPRMNRPKAIQYCVFILL
jgi:hypothetical protein